MLITNQYCKYGTFTSVFKYITSLRSVKKIEIKVDGRIRIRTNSYGSGDACKLNGSYGSGSGTLVLP
jgi:hypothetical protein